MNTQEYFENLLKEINLGIDDATRKQIENKHDDLRIILRDHLGLVDDFLTGSYRRHTLIKPKNGDEKFDLDVFIVFDGHKNGESDLATLRTLTINALKDIQKDHPEMGITRINSEQRRSVGIEFGGNFQMDIVPAIEVEKSKLYKIFDKNTLEAVESNPKLHGHLLSEANKASDGKLVPLVKILKSWKQNKCDYVKSFHLELMAVEIFTERDMESLADGVNVFFNHAESYLTQACLTDPANPNHFVDKYLDDDEKRNQILDLVRTEKIVSQQAISDKGNGDVSNNLWDKIFNDDQVDIATAILAGNLYPSDGGVIATNNSKVSDERIDSPQSWGA